MILSVVSLKGGVGKTTTAIHLAAVTKGVVLDADPERSATSWSELAEGIPPAVPADRDRIARQAKELETRFPTVIIDTPPNDREVLIRAAGVATITVVPVRPTGLDVERLAPTLQLLADLDAERGDLDIALLLTQWDGRRVLARETLEALEGYPVLGARVRNLARYQESFGRSPDYLLEYDAVWRELKDE